MECPICAAEAYVGFSSVECSNPQCEHYRPPHLTIGPNGVMVEVAAKKFLAKLDVQGAAERDDTFLERFEARMKFLTASEGRKIAEEIIEIFKKVVTQDPPADRPPLELC